MSRTDPGSEPPSPHQCPSPSGSHQWALPRDVDEVWGAVPQEAFASLVPKVVHSRVTEQGEVREQLLECCGAVIVIDVSGFSSITSRLRKAGADSAEGVEVLSDELNKYYKGIVDSINDAGGDIVSFSGDNILAVWEAHANNSALRQRRALVRAVSCATALAGATHRIALIKAQLSLHIGVSMGAYKVAVVGGRGTLSTGRWRVALVGEALREAAQAANVASRGEVALPAAVADQLNVAYPSLTLREKQDDFYLIFAAELAAAKRSASEESPPPTAAGSLELVPALFEPGLPTEPDTPLEPRAPDSSFPESAFAKCEGPYHEAQRERNLAVASFALDAVAYILSGQTYGELRKVATVCVRLSTLSEATAFSEENSARDFERLNKAVGIVQRGLLASEGILNKVVLDDQGLTVQCLFGLPRHTHEDDAGRAVSFAVKVAPKLLPVSGDVCIGISRAKVYCGLTGSAVRREYAVIGEGVNTASALMMEAVRRMPTGADTLILTDEATKSTALVPTLLHTLNVAFRSSLQLMHKGQQEPSSVYAIESAECSDSGDVMTSVGVALEALDDSPHHQGQVHSQNKSRAKRGKLARGPSLDEWSPHTSQSQRSPQASHNPRTAQKSYASFFVHLCVLVTPPPLPHGKKGTPQAPPEYSDSTQLPSTPPNPPPSFHRNTVKRTSSRKVIVGQRPRQGSATSTSSSKSPHSRSRRGVGSGDWDPSNPSKQVTAVPGSRQKLFGRVNEVCTTRLLYCKKKKKTQTHLSITPQITAIVHLVHGCSRKMATALSENRRERDAVTCVYIKGDVQMGKTSLLLAASEMATSLTVPFAMIKGSEMSVSTPYVPLVPLVTSFIETTPIQFIEMGFHPHELRPYFPLLHHIVRIPNLAQPSEEQAAMKPSEKGHIINQILLALLRKFYGERCLVLIDDVQWLDNMTLSFARELITGGWRVAMTSRSSSKLAQHGDLTRMSSLTKTRSYASYASDSSDELRFEAACEGDVVEAESRAFDAAVAGHATLQQYKLAPLSARMSAELCCDVFHSTRLSCEVELLVFRKSVGRPGFAKQIAAALAAARLVVVQDGVALFPRGAKDCTETIVHAVPAVEAQIMQFMDTLPDYHKVVAMMLAFLGPVRLRVLEVCVFEHSGAGPFRAAVAFLQTLSLIHRSTQTELAEGRRHTANGLGGNDGDTYPLASSSATLPGPALAASGTDSAMAGSIQRRAPPASPSPPPGADSQLFGRLSVSNGPLEGSLSIGKQLSSGGLGGSLILKDGKVALPRPDNEPPAAQPAAAAAGSASGRARARSKSVVALESDNDEVAFTLPLSGDVLYFSCMAKTKKRFHSVVVSALVGCASFPNEQFAEHCTRSAVAAEELRATVRRAFYAGKARDDLASCLAAVSRQGAFEQPGRLHGASLLLASLLYECGHTTGAAAALRRLHSPDTSTDLAATLQAPRRSSPFSCCCGGGGSAAAASPAGAAAATRAKGPHRLPVSIMLECQFLVLQLEADLWACKAADILRTKKKLETLCGHFPDGELDLGGLLYAVQRVVQDQGEPPPPAVDAPSQPPNDGDLSAQLYPVRAAGGSFAAAGHNPLYQRVVRGSGGGAARAAARTASLSSDSVMSPPSCSGASAQSGSDASPSSQSPAPFTPQRKSLASTLACSDVGSPAPAQALKPGLFYSPYVLISTCMSWECLRVLDRVNRQSTFAASRAASPATSTRSRGRAKSVLGGDCTTPQTSYFGGKLFLMPVPTLQERIMERLNEDLLEPERRSGSITGAFEASFSFGSRRRLREQSLRAASAVGLLNPPACEARARAAAASLKGGDAATDSSMTSPASSLAQPITPVDTSAPQFVPKETALPARGPAAGGLLRHSLKQTSVLLLSAAAVLTGESVARLNPEFFAGVDEAVVWPHMEYLCKLSSILSFVEVSAGSVAQAERVAVRACSDGADATERLLHHAFHTLGRARNGVCSPDLPAALGQVHACGGLITPVHVVGLWALSEAVEIYRELHLSHHVADLCGGAGGEGDDRPRLTAVGSGESLLSTACASRDSGFSDDPTLDDLDAYQQLLRALLEKASASYPIVLPAYHFALGCAQGVGVREKRGHLVAALEACQALWVPHWYVYVCCVV